MIQARANTLPQLQVYYFVENLNHDEADRLPATPGRLSVSAAWQKIINLLVVNYYLSGPPMMLKVITQNLRERQIQAGAIHIDAWE